MIQVLHLSSRWNKLLVSLLTSIQSIVFVCGRISPQVLRCFHKPRKNLLFCCWYFNNSVQAFFVGIFLSNSIVGGVAIFFSVLLFWRPTFYSFIRRHCDVSLLSHHLEWWGSCSFHAYQFNRSVVISFELSHLIKFYLLSQPECCLKSFLPLVPFFQ